MELKLTALAGGKRLHIRGLWLHYALWRDKRKKNVWRKKLWAICYLTTITSGMSELIFVIIVILVNTCFITVVASCSHKHLPISIHPWLWWLWNTLGLGVTWRFSPCVILSTCRWCAGSMCMIDIQMLIIMYTLNLFYDICCACAMLRPILHSPPWLALDDFVLNGWIHLILMVSITAPIFKHTVPLVLICITRYGPLYSCSYLLARWFSNISLSPPLYWCGIHFEFSIILFLQINCCLWALIAVQSARWLLHIKYHISPKYELARHHAKSSMIHRAHCKCSCCKDTQPWIIHA